MQVSTVSGGARLRCTAAGWVLLSAMSLAPGAAAAPFAALMFEDSSIFSPEELLPVYRAELGGALDTVLAGQVAERLTAHYQDSGFLPPAPRLARIRADAGVLVLEIREARISRVQLEGREHVDDPRFWSLVGELRAMQPLHRTGFEDWLGRARELGVAIRGSLIRESAHPHEYVASLRVEPRRWGGLVHLDNRGPVQLGREVAQLSFNYRFDRPALGWYRLDLATAIDSERLRYAGVSGGHRLASRGDQLQWRYSRSESTLPIVDTSRTVDYDRERAELNYIAPLARETRRRADLRLGVRSYDLDQDLDDGRPLRRDRIRTAQVGYSVIVATEFGARHDLDLLLSRGLDGLGASLWPDGAEGDYTAWNLEYGYRRGLGEVWQLWSELSGQVSASRLPASERFFIGGRDLGGAFDPATLSGDQGLGARIGLERIIDLRYVDRPLMVFGYYDHGWVWSNDGARPQDDAGSAGIGLRGRLIDLSWTFELGVPVRSPETPTLLDDDARVFFSLSQRF